MVSKVSRLRLSGWRSQVPRGLSHRGACFLSPALC